VTNDDQSRKKECLVGVELSRSIIITPQSQTYQKRPFKQISQFHVRRSGPVWSGLMYIGALPNRTGDVFIILNNPTGLSRRRLFTSMKTYLFLLIIFIVFIRYIIPLKLA
jgi:hypothetical protein